MEDAPGVNYFPGPGKDINASSCSMPLEKGPKNYIDKTPGILNYKQSQYN
jgi:hypothetical protein